MTDTSITKMNASKIITVEITEKMKKDKEEKIAKDKEEKIAKDKEDRRKSMEEFEKEIDRIEREKIHKDLSEHLNALKKYEEAQRMYKFALLLSPKVPTTISYDIHEFKEIFKKYDHEISRHEYLLEKLRKEIDDASELLESFKQKKKIDINPFVF